MAYVAGLGSEHHLTTNIIPADLGRTEQGAGLIAQAPLWSRSPDRFVSVFEAALT
jgi:hypothetical protein